MLKLDNINVWFGNNHVLRNLNGEIEQGDFIVIVGTNGAGKSTFFDTIAGTIKPKSGSIILDEKEIIQSNEQHRAGIIARLFQNIHLNSVGSLTVMHNIALAQYKGHRARLSNGLSRLSQEQAEKIVRELGMDPAILEKQMNTLSGGQRQLISFAMATQTIPKLLLLDEPTAALDPQSATKLLQYATQWVKRHKVTTLLITHDPELALSIGNKVWVLEDGKISKQFGMEEKKNLNSDDLIGKIDYAQLALSNSL